MTLQEITDAVDAGITVHWINPAYVVVKGKNGYLIKCLVNGSCTGLTWADGVTMNESESDFHIG